MVPLNHLYSISHVASDKKMVTYPEKKPRESQETGLRRDGRKDRRGEELWFVVSPEGLELPGPVKMLALLF